LPRRKNAAVEAVEQPVATTDQMSETAAPVYSELQVVAKKTPAVTSKKGVPVSVSDLLQITSEMEGCPADQIAHACGYYTEFTNTATGETDVRVTRDDSFNHMQALLASHGTNLAPPTRSTRRSNRQPIIKIGKTGNIVVGGRYTNVAGFSFGEEVDSRVRVEAEPGKITIFAAAPGEYASEDQGGDDLDDLDDYDSNGLDEDAEESDLDL
jgi:hypothetical protein